MRPSLRTILWLVAFEIIFLNGGCFSIGSRESTCRPRVISSCE